MKILEQRIQQSSHDLGRGVIRVDSFLNHQVDPELMRAIGTEFARLFGPLEPTKILTVETGGIAPALVTALKLDIPLIIARKRRAAGMPRELLTESTLSQTRHEAIDLFVSPDFLSPADRVVIIDDFLTHSQVILALSRLAQRGGATVVGVGAVIEKALEGGRASLSELNVPVESLVRIGKISSDRIEFLD
jgi:xanthine phosphoribosyltransferase